MGFIDSRFPFASRVLQLPLAPDAVQLWWFYEEHL